MSKRGSNASRRGVGRVLVYGEDRNDTRALKELIEALCPALAGRVVAVPDPPVLIKGAHARDVPDRAKRIAALVRAERVKHDVVCVFAHEDCDDVEPAHVSLIDKIERAFAAVNVSVHAVAPAWELEAWLFLWPDVVSQYRPSWRRPDDYVGKSVGLATDAKEKFRRAVRSRDKRSTARDYRESDAPEIMRLVAQTGVARQPMAKSDSYLRFVSRVDECCAST